MKNTSIIKLFSALLVISAFMITTGCKKEASPSGPGNIEFVSLTIEKDNVAIQELTKVTANVIGENLTFTWKCDNELGVFEGSGAEVLFTICHGGKFKITCEVKDDANNKATKDVYVNYIE